MEAAATLQKSASMTSDDSFDAFFRANYVRLARASFLLTGNREEAEDIAQEAMAKVYARWDRVQPMASSDGYVFRTALNIVRKRRRRDALLPGDRAAQEQDVPDPAVEVAERDRVMRALLSLPLSQREALVLVEWLALDTGDAARVLGIAPATIRVRLHRARAQLRQTLGGTDG